MANQRKAKKNSSLYEEQRRRTAALAEKEELLNKKRKGELIERSAAENEWFRLARQVRDRMQNIPARLAGLLVGMKDQHKIHEMIKKEIDEALEALAS
jgi:phage terminase Nu1 subunit (DNA packaging protein)